MVDVVLFHHVQGLTDGVRALADDLRAGRHVVQAPDLFDAHTFGSVEEGFAYLRGLDEGEVDRRVDASLAALPPAVVYAGVSFGVMQAQRLAQTRAGSRGALLYESCLPLSGEWAVGPWPDGLPVQVHGAEGDEFFAEDLPAARELVEVAAPQAELFTYPGDRHLFTDRSLPSYDAEATALVISRSLDFLDRLGEVGC